MKQCDVCYNILDRRNTVGNVNRFAGRSTTNQILDLPLLDEIWALLVMSVYHG